MAQVQVNDIQIEYDTTGNPEDPALLLIIGLGGQLIYWPDEFCSQLAQNGYYVVRFDNRESGLSTQKHDLTLDEISDLTLKIFDRQTPKIPFTIDDLAEDAAGLLDALKIDKAHICGMSMGGFIAQTLCINHPSRVLSLTSIYSYTGARGPEFVPEKQIFELLLKPLPQERDAFINDRIHFFRQTYGTGKQFDETFHRNLLEASVDRSFHLTGTALQYLAILMQKDRTQALEQLDLPALVIHGDADPLVPVSGGIATAKALKNATLKIIDGMGHVMPNLDAYWSQILDDMVAHMNRAGKQQ